MKADERQAAWAALGMIRDAIGELYGPVASIESEEAVLLRGPEFHHEAEAIVAALQRVREGTNFYSVRAGNQPKFAWGTRVSFEASGRVERL